MYDDFFHVKVGSFFVLSIEVNLIDQRHQFVRKLDIYFSQEMLDLPQGLVTSLLIGQHLPSIGRGTQTALIFLLSTHLDCFNILLMIVCDMGYFDEYSVDHC